MKSTDGRIGSDVHILLLMVLMAVCESVSFACECDSVSLENEYDRSIGVFLGQVIRFVHNGDGDSLLHNIATVVVEQQWKGGLGDTVEICTGTGGPDCGFPFDVGERYVIFCTQQNEKLTTSRCTLTTLASKAKVQIEWLSRLSRTD